MTKGTESFPDTENGKAEKHENPLANIMVNVLIPVIALSLLSKDEGKPWHIGPLWGMMVAVAFPVVYGIYDLISNQKMNFFSILGVASILLTGGITLYVWNEDGTVKPNAAFLFAVKEATIPVTFGTAILTSHWTNKPLIRIFLYTSELFNVERIEENVQERKKTEDYQKLLFSTTVIIASSFFLSAILNYGLAMHFLVGSEHSRIAYNAAIGKLTGWGFLVIGLPSLLISLVAMWRLIQCLRKITGLVTEDIFVKR